MDLVRQLRDVRFELAMRGYDTASVDTFLAKLRTDIATIQEEHAAAQARIAELEAYPPSDASETEGTLRRTLLLAQRLADETEAEAKAAAVETVSAATAEADQMREAAEVEAASMRRAGEEELAAARDEAEAVRQTMNEQAARDRAEARATIEAMLADAEATAQRRVEEIEQRAQAEAATMREPVREEVQQLEGVRSQLLGDISELESHLESQRVRVKNAVEALRVGMSGSIDDLQRVADDDALLATEPAPGHSGASADDVELAPDIEIRDRVAEVAPEAPSVDDIEARAEAVAAEAMAEAEVADEEVAEEEVAEAEVAEAEVAAEVPDHGPDTEPIPVVEVEVAEAEVIEVADEETTGDDVAVDEDDGETMTAEAAFAVLGGASAAAVTGAVDAPEDAPAEMEPPAEMEAPEPVAMATAADLEEADLVVLDDEETALFGTDLGAEAQTAEVVDADAASEVEEAADSGPAEQADTQAEGMSFVDRFAASLDEVPVRHQG